MRRVVGACIGTVLFSGLVGAMPAAATGERGSQPPTFTVVADNLNSPRQIVTYGPAVAVVEAGTGGDPTACLAGQPCVGLTGSVTAVLGGQASRVQTGLLSISSPGEGGGPDEVVGVDALAIAGPRLASLHDVSQLKLYGVATGTCDLPPGLPPEVGAQVGKVLQLFGGDKLSVVGDASTIECSTDPDGQGPDTDPYGIAVKDGKIYVADAAGNDVVKIRNGHTSVATVLSTTGQPVPTSLAFGPDGALYIGTLNFEAGPGGAAVYRLAPGASTATVYASGLSAITGIAFGKHGQLYVAEFTTGFDENGPSPDGDVVVVPWGGGSAGRRTLGTGQLHFPGGVGVTSDGAVYVSNWSTASGVDGPFGPGNHGQLIKITEHR
jgi:hypothetical protein